MLILRIRRHRSLRSDELPVLFPYFSSVHFLETNLYMHRFTHLFRRLWNLFHQARFYLHFNLLWKAMLFANSPPRGRVLLNICVASSSLLILLIILLLFAPGLLIGSLHRAILAQVFVVDYFRMKQLPIYVWVDTVNLFSLLSLVIIFIRDGSCNVHDIFAEESFRLP